MNVNGLEFISVRGKIRKVMDEEKDHYHVYPNGFVVYKRYIKKVIKGKVGVYDDKQDDTGRLIVDKDYRKEFSDNLRRIADVVDNIDT